jgi:hypothetical protein
VRQPTAEELVAAEQLYEQNLNARIRQVEIEKEQRRRALEEYNQERAAKAALEARMEELHGIRRQLAGQLRIAIDEPNPPGTSWSYRNPRITELSKQIEDLDIQQRRVASKLWPDSFPPTEQAPWVHVPPSRHTRGGVRGST